MSTENFLVIVYITNTEIKKIILSYNEAVGSSELRRTVRGIMQYV